MDKSGISGPKTIEGHYVERKIEEKNSKSNSQ